MMYSILLLVSPSLSFEIAQEVIQGIQSIPTLVEINVRLTAGLLVWTVCCMLSLKGQIERFPSYLVLDMSCEHLVRGKM